MSISSKKTAVAPISQQIGLWINAFRPKTLTAAIVPIVIATSYVYFKTAVVHFKIGFCALMSSIFIQIGTNLVNDAADFKTGADGKDRVGPMRVTSSGHFSYRQVMGAALVSFMLAVAFAVPLVFVGGAPIVWIGIFSIVCAYAYTAGPFPLAYKGLGDIFVILFFGLIAVGGMGFLYFKAQGFDLFNSNAFNINTLTFKLLGALNSRSTNVRVIISDLVVLGLQIGFLAAVLIAINNLRDIETDRLVNKNTMAVRLGKHKARFEILFLVVAPFLMNLYWASTSIKLALLPMLVLPLAVKVIRNIFTHEPSSTYNQFLGQAAGLHLLFGILLSIGFLIG